MSWSDGALDMPNWWIAFFSVSLVFAVGISALASFAAFHRGTKEGSGREQKGKQANSEDLKKGGRQQEGVQSGDEVDSIEKEAWCPKYVRKQWNEVDDLPACPWNFEGCDTISQVIDSIWRWPLSEDLSSAVSVLKQRVKNISVAWISLPCFKEEHYVAIYTLASGAELFGGPPLDLGIGLDFSNAAGPCEDELTTNNVGMRHRFNKPKQKQKLVVEEEEFYLPCLAPFYRMHDGFGILLSSKHLPLLVSSPTDEIHGSCHYLYPCRAVEPTAGRRHLYKFARVDRNCVACTDSRDDPARVLYVERDGQVVEDDSEEPMSFVADTISNIAGQRVVPPGYMTGQNSTVSMGNAGNSRSVSLSS